MSTSALWRWPDIFLLNLQQDYVLLDVSVLLEVLGDASIIVLEFIFEISCPILEMRVILIIHSHLENDPIVRF